MLAAKCSIDSKRDRQASLWFSSPYTNDRVRVVCDLCSCYLLIVVNVSVPVGKNSSSLFPESLDWRSPTTTFI